MARICLGLSVAALLLFSFGGGPGAPAGRTGSVAHGCIDSLRNGSLSPDSCTVPGGGTLDICFLVGILPYPDGVNGNDGACAGKIIDYPVPDINPLDWLAWLLCSILAESGAIFNAIADDIGNFLVMIANDLFTAFEAPFNTVVAAIENSITTAVGAFASLLTGFFNAVNGVAQPLGPLSPILVVALTLAIFLAAIVGLYFVVIILFAFGKTLFNLL